MINVERTQRESAALALRAVWVLACFCACFGTPSYGFDRICSQPALLAGDDFSMEYGIYEGELFSEDVAFWAEDVDGDGDQDAILLGGFNPYREAWDGVGREGRLLLNNGNGDFVPVEWESPPISVSARAYFADFDSNGLIDFFFADIGWDAPPFPGHPNGLMLQFESGWINASDRLPDDPSGFTSSSALGDIDNDGDVDIFVLNNGNGGDDNLKYLLINDGAANFTIDNSVMPEGFPEDGSFVPEWNSWFSVFADLDGDGFLDLVKGGNEPNLSATTIYWGDPNGFSNDRVTELDLAGISDQLGVGALQIVVAKSFDVNGDGRSDLFLSGTDDTYSTRFVQLWMNAGERAFLEQSAERLGDQATAIDTSWLGDVIWTDFNQDGFQDIVPQKTTPSGTKDIFAWLGDGEGYFTPLTLSNSNFEDIETAFINHWVISDAEFNAPHFFEYQGKMRANRIMPARTSVIDGFPCPLSVEQPLIPTKKFGLEDELLR